MKKRNVLVTGTGGRSVGSGILHSLLRTGVEVSARWNVIAADADPFAWGIYKTGKSAVLPFANSPKYLDVLADLVKKHEVKAILPGTEVETELLSSYNDGFQGAQIISNKASLMPLMMDKLELPAVLKQAGLKMIPTHPLSDWSTVEAQFGFPLVIKPTVGTGGSKGLRLVLDKEEIEQLIEVLADEVDTYCVQPYLGSSREEFTVGILSQKDGKLIDSIVMRRKLLGLSLLTKRKYADEDVAISTGYSQGFIERNEEVQSFCESVAASLGSVGPLNLQLRKHEGEFYIFDFHPRFSGTTPIRSDVGFNEPDTLLRNYLDGEQFERLGYTSEVAAIRAFEHVIVPKADYIGPFV